MWVMSMAVQATIVVLIRLGGRGEGSRHQSTSRYLGTVNAVRGCCREWDRYSLFQLRRQSLGLVSYFFLGGEERRVSFVLMTVDEVVQVVIGNKSHISLVVLSSFHEILDVYWLVFPANFVVEDHTLFLWRGGEEGAGGVKDFI